MDSDKNVQNRIIGYDYLRTISIFMVVVLHGTVIYKQNCADSVSFNLCNCFLLIYNIAVPCMFMISGALLLDRAPSINDNKKRLINQGVPFIIWSIVYVLARIIMGIIPFSLSSFVSLLQEPAYYQFWFMYTLLGIYLILPILQLLVSKMSQEQFKYVLLIWLIFSVFQPTISHYIPALSISEHIDLILSEGYIGYFLLGYYLKKYSVNSKKRELVFFAVLGFMITCFGAVIESIFVGTDIYWGSYLTPGVLISSVAIFLLFQKIQWKSNRIIVNLSKNSIGVYYIHMLSLTLLEKIGFSGSDNFFVCQLKCICGYAISFFAAYIISKIPYIRKYLLGYKR